MFKNFSGTQTEMSELFKEAQTKMFEIFKEVETEIFSDFEEAQTKLFSNFKGAETKLFRNFEEALTEHQKLKVYNYIMFNTCFVIFYFLTTKFLLVKNKNLPIE